MKNRILPHRGWMTMWAALIVLSAGGWLAPQAVAAGNLDKLDTSLKLIPADASFYLSKLRIREQIEAFLQSNAYEKIKSMPSVQTGLAMFNAQAQQPGSPVSKFQMARENPEIKKLINLAADMGANDIFIYGGENVSDFVELMQCFGSNTRYGPAVLEASGEAKGLNYDKLQQKMMLQTLIDHTDIVEFPNVLIGFRLKKPAAATEALIKLEMTLNLAMEALPQLKGHLNKETIDEHEYLVLRLDGKMIPWNKVPMNEFKKLVKDENELQKLVEHVKEMNLVIAMGVRDNDLLITLGSSVDCIKKLGSGERLIDLPEFKPLEKFVDKRLTGIGYINKELIEQLNNNAKNIDDLRDFLMQMIPLAKFSDEQNDQMSKDIESIADDLKGMIPEMGSIMGFSFLTDIGYESYRYTWGKCPHLDGAKSLELLNHVGGNPILGIVGRNKGSVEDYDKLVKWVKVGLKYMKEVGLPRLPAEQREKAESFIKDAAPLLERFEKAHRDMHLALADGQIGLVIDAKLKSKQLHKSMPALDRELPVIEPALVVGVSDPELLEKGIGEIRGVYNDLLDLICKQKDVPQEAEAKIKFFKWPEAKLTIIEGGPMYSYPLPENFGLDKNIVPNAALGFKVAVLTLSPKQTERLVKDTPLKVGGVLINTNRPLAVAGWIDWKELLGALTPWVNYSLEKMTDQQLGGQKELVVAQAHTALEVLSTIKSITSESYIEDGVLVNHSLLEIHDLGK